MCDYTFVFLCLLSRLNLYKSIPKNGLAIFSGTIMTERGKRDTLTYHFEPPKEIPNGLYRCGAKFDTEVYFRRILDE